MLSFLVTCPAAFPSLAFKLFRYQIFSIKYKGKIKWYQIRALGGHRLDNHITERSDDAINWDVEHSV
jgi:hypothetical protein